MTNKLSYTLFGAAFGFCFPIFSILLDMLVFKGLAFSFANVAYVHTVNYLHFVIDTAPFFLGLAFGVAGWKQDNLLAYHQKLQVSREKVLTTLRENEKLIREQNLFLEQTVDYRTEELASSNEELKQIVEELNSTLELVNQQKLELNQKNNNITANIRYALSIQQATLPTHTQLKTLFVDYLLIFLPKDIVSGDFYWVYQPPKQVDKQEVTFLSVIDCTGHGVSGAFMAMMSYCLLNEIVKTQQNEDPATILTELHQSFKQIFNASIDQTLHGNADLVFCKLTKEKESNPTNTLLSFASTRRPVFVFRQQTEQIEKIKKEKDSHKHHFTNQTVDLQSADVLYLFTDGFADQHNAALDRFGTSRLETLLQTIGKLPLKEQKQILLQELETYKTEVHQRDDITALGIRVG